MVVWEVIDTAEAVFEVDNLKGFVSVQSEAAVRNLATRYAYDNHESEVSLRSHTKQISEELRQEVQNRLEKAGVRVIELRISHLAYAPEIASAMLRRQQAMVSNLLVVLCSDEAASPVVNAGSLY